MTRKGYYGEYGGQFVPELLMPAINEVTEAFNKVDCKIKPNT
ncbi:hypothetical protein [Leuconostoc mesenteroides]|nr:hypothetical protein [Leuconostoc mesenteroides]